MTGEDKHKQLEAKPETEVAFDDAPDPDAAMPVPIPGMDLQMFKNYWMRALSGDADVPPAILMLVRQTREGANASEKRSEQEWEELFTQYAVAQRLREIDRLIDQYNQMADWHHEQAEKARAKMREAADKLMEIDEFVSGVDEILRAKEETGKFDREKAIALLKKRGVKVDPNESDAILKSRLEREKQRALDELPNWSKQYDDAKSDAKYNERMEQENRKKAQELVERRDAIHKHGYDAAEEERKLRKVTDEYNPDVQQKAVEMEKARNGRAMELTTRVETSLVASQQNQTGSEVSDFDALAGTLKKEFTASAANVVTQSQPLTPARPMPSPATPSPSA